MLDFPQSGLRSQGGPKPLVAVAMSGGVDSSVAAARLVEAGHPVVGMMLRLWAEPGAAGANKCCTLGAVDDARAVANHLDIPFSVIDCTEHFKAAVVDDFLVRSAQGETPNPCFTCNRQVRFGFLLDRARALGAEGLATGHYARVATAPDGRRRLLRGADPDKDQSYVLHRLNQDQLAAAIFPVGDMPKTAVRELAVQYGLSTASRKDSVDLCWVGPGGVAGFLDRHLTQPEPGDIVRQDGERLGSHRGLAAYTLGQRRGLGVATGEPVYVIERDVAANRLVVGPREALMHRQVAVCDVHWIAGEAPVLPLEVTAKIRYGAPDATALVTDRNGEGVWVTFDSPQRAPAPGQGLVFYSGDEVLGGGTIARQESSEA